MSGGVTGTHVAGEGNWVSDSNAQDNMLLAAAPKASPVFSGTPQAPTAAPGDSTNQLANTAFVAAAATATLASAAAATRAASSVSYTPGGNISATTAQAAIAELDLEKLAVTALTAVPVVVVLSGNTPLSSEGLDGDLGRGADGSTWGPKASGAWPGTARNDLVSALTLNVAGAASFAGQVRAATNNRTGTITLTSASANYQTLDTSSGAFVLTLHTPANPVMFTFLKTDSSTNACTITPPSGTTISGAANYVLSARYKYVNLFWAGTNWYVVGSN